MKSSTSWYYDLVCVYMRVYVFMCVFILFHREGFLYQQDVWDMLEGYGSTILCCEYHFRWFCQVSSSLFLKMSYLTSKNKTPAYDIYCLRKKEIYIYIYIYIYIDIGNKSPNQQTNKWWKDTKDKKATMI